MKILVTEGQLRNLVKRHRKTREFEEAASLTSPSTSNQTTGSSSSPSGGSSSGEGTGEVVNVPERPDGVPEMNKWPSQKQGPEHGRANPVGTVKPWESGLGRTGPAVQLK